MGSSPRTGSDTWTGHAAARLRGLARRAALAARGLVARVWPPAAELRLDRWEPTAPGRRPGRLATDDAEVTERLCERLDAGEVARIEERLLSDPRPVPMPVTPGMAPRFAPPSALWPEATPLERKRLTLAFGIHYDAPEVVTKTGLSRATPPGEVHSMGRGALAVGGSVYHADLVVAALRSAGRELRPGHRMLDFGCSSGRVVRVLAAAYPEVEWHGCDPIEASVRWASENLPGIEFTLSSSRPPLPYATGSLDAVFAISIWSHFAEPAALRWFAEMRRLMRPGGHLMVTTHGFQSLSYYAERGLRSRSNLASIRDSLYEVGFWFRPEFGPRGDWGLIDPEWGTAFFTAEWLVAHLCPQWRLIEFAAGRNEGNQDVYVLERG